MYDLLDFKFVPFYLLFWTQESEPRRSLINSKVLDLLEVTWAVEETRN